MAGGRPMFTLTSTPALVGIGTATANARSKATKHTLFTFFPPMPVPLLFPSAFLLSKEDPPQASLGEAVSTAR